jgi:thiol-disulfide isomerase/thioredoxin
MKRFSTASCLLLALVGLASSALAPPSPKRMLNQPAPLIQGQTLSGRLVDARYFRGKVTLINFMYLGCAPCMAEVPVLHRLQAQVRDSTFQILSIAAHTATQLRNFNQRDGSPQAAIRRHFGIDSIRYELLPECEKPQTPRSANVLGPECSTLSARFFLDGYPLSLLIDRQGVVRNIYEGFPMQAPFLAQSEARLQKDVQKLLDRK